MKKVVIFIVLTCSLVSVLNAYDLFGRFIRSDKFKWESHDGDPNYHDLWSWAFHIWRDNTSIDGFHLISGNENIDSVSLNYGPSQWAGRAIRFFYTDNGCPYPTVMYDVELKMNRFYTDQPHYGHGQKLAVAFHEFGHAFGLNHVPDMTDIMYDPAFDQCELYGCPTVDATTGVNVLYQDTVMSCN